MRAGQFFFLEKVPFLETQKNPKTVFYLHSILSCLKELLNYIFLNIFYYYFGPPWNFLKKVTFNVLLLGFWTKKNYKTWHPWPYCIKGTSNNLQKHKIRKMCKFDPPHWTVYNNNLFCLTIHKCKLLNISLSRHFIGSTDIQYITVLLYI